MHQLPQEVGERDSRTGGGRGGVLFALALAAGLLLAAPLLAGPRALPGGGGAIVDGVAIPAREIWQEYAYTHGVTEVIHARPAGTINEAAFEMAVRHVVDRALLARAAAGKGLALTAQERADLRALQVAGWRGEANFQAALAMLRVSEEFLLRRMETNLLSRKLIEPEALAGGALDEQALREFHRANPAVYINPSPTLRYLLLPADFGAGGLPEFHQERDQALEQRKDFSALVRRFSIHASAAQGGVVEGAAASSWPYPQLAKHLKPGRVSREMRDAAGVHLYARDTQLPLPFESVRDRVRTDLAEYLVRQRQAAVVLRLRGESVIEYLPGASESAPPGSGPAHSSPAQP